MTAPFAGALRATVAQVADPAQLAAAWSDVLASDQEDGTLGHGVARFAEDADDQLVRIAEDIRAGTYQPGQLGWPGRRARTSMTASARSPSTTCAACCPR